MSYSHYLICPVCEAEGKGEHQVEPVFAVHREEIQKINPMLPDIRQITNMFQTNRIEDLGFCENGHGLVNMKKKCRMVPETARA